MAVPEVAESFAGEVNHYPIAPEPILKTKGYQISPTLRLQNRLCPNSNLLTLDS